MHFRVSAAVKKVTARGNPYWMTVWIGEFCDTVYTEQHAQDYARNRVRETLPTLTEYELLSELVPDIYLHH